MGIALILEILAVVRQLSGVAETLRQSQGLTKEQLIQAARAKDTELASFIETELAKLGGGHA